MAGAPGDQRLSVVRHTGFGRRAGAGTLLCIFEALTEVEDRHVIDRPRPVTLT
jgi:hypothetical protein